ncbi:MAG: hypothetical protein LBJ02_06145 [Bifidobacteriaceae bacterium]|jgi:uncharacterized protein YukE|nr:hypothetical protein [Bifidobacteriaceae bacterium]
MMSIDVGIEGDPDALFASASWLRYNLGAELEAAKRMATRCIDTGGWRGEAAEAFSARMSEIRELTGGMMEAAEMAGAGIREYAAALEEAQSQVKKLLDEAAGLGLKVDGNVITGPPDAEYPDHALSSAEPSRYWDLVDAARLSQRFDDMVKRFATVLEDLRQATDRLKDISAEIEQFGVKDLAAVGGGSSGLAASLLSAKTQYKSHRLADVAKGLAESAGSHTPELATLAQRSTVLGSQAVKLKASGVIVGAGFTDLGVSEDMKDGESFNQGVVSQGAGRTVAGTSAEALATATMSGVVTAFNFGAAAGPVVPVVGVIAGGLVTADAEIWSAPKLNEWVDSSWEN